MKQELRRRYRIWSILAGVVLTCSGPVTVRAQTLQETACAVFEGARACRTVSVVDEDQCVIKISPNPVPDLDPEIGGCLIEDVQTKKIFLTKLRMDVVTIATPSRVTAEKTSKSTIRVSGHGAIHVLTTFDNNGAPVWETRSAETFEHAGEPEDTAKALDHLSSTLCNRAPEPETIFVAQKPSKGSGAVPPRIIGVKEAFRQAAEGRVVLVDIRHESEWRKTGVGVHAVPITMHQRKDDFFDQLNRVAGADNRTPIALICAGGVRSSMMQKVLQRNGYSNVIDVNEGMLGNLGWIRSGLPVTPYKP